MSTRTIIEINHDFLNDLEREPAVAMAMIRRIAIDPYRHHPGNVLGIQFIAQRHHTEDVMEAVRFEQVRRTFGEGRKP
jgi:hypothetical protein